jgi:leucyl/phenylalanyl-tRNA---protein transferase
VMYVDEFRLSRSLRKTVQRFARAPNCAVRIDSDFRAVVAACAATPRPGQDGTWIVPEMVEAYCAWHAQRPDVHSVETWVDGELVGGLYGVGLGRMFFGESMFSHRTDASKVAFAALICLCRERGIGLIDCQQRTGHLASLGAREIPRRDFERELSLRLKEPRVTDWTYDLAMWRHLTGEDRPLQDPGP